MSFDDRANDSPHLSCVTREPLPAKFADGPDREAGPCRSDRCRTKVTRRPYRMHGMSNEIRVTARENSRPAHVRTGLSDA